MDAIKDYMVVGYYNGKAIITDELEQIYYLPCESSEAPIGTVVEEIGVHPITDLDTEEEKKVRMLFPELDA